MKNIITRHVRRLLVNKMIIKEINVYFHVSTDCGYRVSFISIVC